MTHETESTFMDACRRMLFDTLGDDAHIAQNAYLPRSGRYADFIVTFESPGEGDNLVLAVEVENDFEALINGIGQAAMYAGHFKWAYPVVMYPEGHAEEPELSALHNGTNVHLIEVPAEYESPPETKGDA